MNGRDGTHALDGALRRGQTRAPPRPRLRSEKGEVLLRGVGTLRYFFFFTKCLCAVAAAAALRCISKGFLVYYDIPLYY